MTEIRNKRREFKKLIKRLMPIMFSAAGFIAGALAGAFSGGMIPSLPAPDMSSAYGSSSPFYFTVTCISSEMKYAVLVYMLGFCTFGAPVCLIAASYRAALAGWSAVYLLKEGYPLGVYFVHSVTSLIFTALLCCLCILSIEHSERFARGGERADREQIWSYTVKCLFFGGLTVCVVIIRQLLLLIT